MRTIRLGFSIRFLFTAMAALLWQTAAPLAQTPMGGAYGERQVKFERIAVAEGLSQSTVYCVLQDRQGFMWFGTGAGLNKYDGYRFTTYKHEATDSTSISGDWIKCIYEDHSGALWIGTYNYGLNRFDRETEHFTRFIHDPNNPRSLSDNEVNAIYEDHAGTLWVGTENGLNRLDRSDSRAEKFNENRGKTFTRFLPDPLNPRSLSHPTVSAIYEDRFNTLWIGTGGGGLNRFDPEAKQFTHFVHDPNDPQSLSDDFVRAIYEDRAGRLWIGTEHGGLNKLDRATQTGAAKAFTHFLYDPKNPRGLSHPEVRAICEDRLGKLWLGTLGGGLNYFDPEASTGSARQFTHYVNDPKNLNSLSNNRVFSICEDRSGTLWIGTDIGFNRLDRGQGSFIALVNELENAQNSSHNIIWSINKDSAKRSALWIGTESGLFRRTLSDLYGPRDGLRGKSEEQVFYFNNNPKNPLSLRENKIHVIYEDSQGTFWFGTAGGIKLFVPDFLSKRNNGQSDFKRWEEDAQNPSGLNRLQIFAICEDSTARRKGATNRLSPAFGNTFWIGTDGGLFRLRREERGETRLTVFKRDHQNPNSLNGNNVRSLLVDRSGTLWVGTWADGLHRFDEQSGEFKRFVHDAKNSHSVANNFIRCIYEDRAGRLWIGTDGGLDELDRATKQFKHYTEKDGLPNNKIWGILEDDRGRLWLSTNNGISRFEPSASLSSASTSSAFKNYTVRDGLSHQEFNRGAYFKSDNGEMFFGGMNGVTAFHPDSIRDNPFVPPVVITACKRYNIDYAEGVAIVEKGIFARREIEFSYKDNIISFEFAALNFRNSQQNQYAYKLEGYHEQWIQLGTHREATFTNLDPGEYILHVKGSNNDGVWNEEGTSLKIIITPPWWKTWWAYSLYGVIFFSILYGLRRYEMNRQQFKHRAELEHVQAEKLQELDHLKSRFFANISHEFRTPLTLIMGQVDALQTEETASSKKAKLSMAAGNAQKLLTLINQLLDLSKFEAGQMTLRASLKNIVPLLKHLTSTFESWAAQKKIVLQFESSQDDIPVWFEQDKIEKVMYNLLSNALKFTPEGGRVSVQVSVISDQLSVISDQLSVISNQLPVKKLITDNCLLITVRDSGIGIPHDRLPHIFDRFYQVDSSQTREYEGTGIGLALAQELVQLHGGGISVESAPGFGTTFVVSLPLGNAHLKPEQIVSDSGLRISDTGSQVPDYSFVDISTSPSTDFRKQPAFAGIVDLPDQDKSEIRHPKSEFILIVEDNADMRTFIGESLQGGYRLVEAANGEEGFIKAQEYIPDLIITDVMMPRVDGYEMTRRIRQDQVTCHIPIIMLTAKAAEEDKFEGLEQGVDAYLTKPFNKKELQIRVRKLIELRQQLRQQAGTKAVLAPAKIEASSLDQQFLQRLQEIIEENLENEDFTVDDLAAQAGVGQRQLQRKLKALTDSSPQQCIRSMRLQRARQLLEQGAGTVSEIAFRVCYGTVAAFSEAFREEFGEPPSAVKPKKGK